MGKVERFTARGYLAMGVGVLFLADAVGCGNAYGYCAGSAFEFALGTLAVVAGAWQVYLAGVYRDRLLRAEEERRRAARERRVRERQMR